MLHDIVEARALDGHRLFVRFDDGTTGILDIAAFTKFDGVFAPLQEPANFARVRVDADLGTVVWPSGANLCPDTLYAYVTGQILSGWLTAEERVTLARRVRSLSPSAIQQTDSADLIRQDRDTR